ncbi:hypothetical protein LCGC14_1681750, partial [marine sediment metagenome]
VMFEKNKSFDIADKKFEDIQEQIEWILKTKLLYSTTTTRLGNSILRINYNDKNIEIESQKDNRITILQEQGKKIYIQIAGVLDDVKVGQLWEELNVFFLKESINIIKDSINETEENLDESEESIEIIEILPSKDELVEEIKKLLENVGYILEMEEVETFINNFIEKYDRLPVLSELKAIIKGYILMIQEEKKLKSQITEPIIEESQEDLPSEEVHQEVITQDYLTKELISPEELNQEEISQEGFPIDDFKELVLSKQEIVGRRRCPNCGNEGLIREVDDKTKILMDYPKIYAKKRCCVKCGFEWHAE